MRHRRNVTFADAPDHNTAQHQGRLQVAAYYFPSWHNDHRLHPTDEGEWGTLKSAKPRFPGQPQPKIPFWGYQDEADPAVMAQKIDAAATHGVDAFLFDWYWHDRGKWAGPVLERALDDGYLKSPNHSRVKFALMWANHDLGGESPGPIGREGFDAMADHVVKDYFSSDSYWVVDGRFYFSIFMVDNLIKGLGGLQQAKDALDSFRARTLAAHHKGIYLNIIDIEMPKDPQTVFKTLGVDSITSYNWVGRPPLKSFPKTDYAEEANLYYQFWDAHKNDYGVPYFPNVTVGWDPTPRVPASVKYDGHGYPNTPVLWDNRPEKFKAALIEARTRALQLPAGQRVVTVYAWNEWTEGGYLEPDTDYKMGYLDAIRDVFGVHRP